MNRRRSHPLRMPSHTCRAQAPVTMPKYHAPEPPSGCAGFCIGGDSPAKVYFRRGVLESSNVVSSARTAKVRLYWVSLLARPVAFWHARNGVTCWLLSLDLFVPNAELICKKRVRDMHIDTSADAQCIQVTSTALLVAVPDGRSWVMDVASSSITALPVSAIATKRSSVAAGLVEAPLLQALLGVSKHRQPPHIHCPDTFAGWQVIISLLDKHRTFSVKLRSGSNWLGERILQSSLARRRKRNKGTQTSLTEISKG